MTQPRHHTVQIGSIAIGNDMPLVVILGPCQIESRDHALRMAERIAEICARSGHAFVYKSSFDKANRTSLEGARGVGLDEGLRILDEVRAKVGCPVLTDVHEPSHCATVAEVAGHFCRSRPSSVARPICFWRPVGPAGRSMSKKDNSSRRGTWAP